MHKFIPGICLFFIIAFHIMGNSLWLSFHDDFFLHESVDYYLITREIFFQWQTAIMQLSNGFPHHFPDSRWHGVFVEYLVAPFFFIMCPDRDSAVIAQNIVFFSLLIYSTYGIARRLFDIETGLVSALILSVFPIIFVSSRMFLLDIPLAAMVALCLLMFIRSNFFSRPNYVVGFAITAICGLLIKFNMLLFVAPTVLLLLSNRYRNKLSFPTLRLGLLLLGVIIFIPVLVYGARICEIVERVYNCSWIFSINYYPQQSIAFLIKEYFKVGVNFIGWFIHECANNMVSALFLVPFILGLFKLGQARSIILTWMLFPLFIMSFFFYNPDINRYFIPLLPPMAIIASLGITRFFSGKLKRLFLIIVLSLGIMQYFLISFPLDSIPDRLTVRAPILGDIILFNKRIFAGGYRTSDHPDKFSSMANSSYFRLMNDILNDAGVDRERVKVFFLSKEVSLGGPLRQISYEWRDRIDFYQLFDQEERVYQTPFFPTMLISSADYLILGPISDVSTGKPGIFNKLLIEANNYINDRRTGLQLINTYKISDSSSLLLFKKATDHVQISNNNILLRFRDGATKVYYKGMKLTSWTGFELGYIAGNGPVFISDFFWSIKEITSNLLVMTGAIDQGVDPLIELRFELADEHSLNWSVSISPLFKGNDRKFFWAFLLNDNYRTCTKKGIETAFTPNFGVRFNELVWKDNLADTISCTAHFGSDLPALSFVSHISPDSIAMRTYKKIKMILYRVNSPDVMEQNGTLFKGTISFHVN